MGISRTKLTTIRRIAQKHPFWSNVMMGDDAACWAWTGQVDAGGYGYMGRDRAHRIAWELANAETLQPGLVVRHSCDNPPCCNPMHLLAGKDQDNVDDRVSRDRSAKGVANGRAKLTATEVLAIFVATDSLAEIAEKFGISKWTARDIKKGKIWRWLTSISHGGKFKPENRKR